MMSKRILYHLLLFIYFLVKGSDIMKPSYLVMLFTNEIMEGNITIEDVPAGLKSKVKSYLESLGYDFNAK